MPQLGKSLVFVICTAFAVCAAVSTARAEIPKPSPYPISWELNFEHSKPKRIVVDVPGESAPKAYWYMTYTVTNKTGMEQIWAPTFELVDNDGKIVKAGHNIAPEAFGKIKDLEKNQFLQPMNTAVGDLHQGDDQAKDSVAIWKEPNPRMGTFKIFVGGLSGEVVVLKDDDGKDVKDPDGQPVLLRKTLELTYAVYGDEFYPQRHDVHQLAETWVMR